MIGRPRGQPREGHVMVLGGAGVGKLSVVLLRPMAVVRRARGILVRGPLDPGRGFRDARHRRSGRDDRGQAVAFPVFTPEIVGFVDLGHRIQDIRRHPHRVHQRGAIPGILGERAGQPGPGRQGRGDGVGGRRNPVDVQPGHMAGRRRAVPHVADLVVDLAGGHPEVRDDQVGCGGPGREKEIPHRTIAVARNRSFQG